MSKHIVHSPVVMYRPGQMKAHIGKMPLAKLMEVLVKEDYIDEEGFEPELHGLTRMEVMIIRQIRNACKGDGDAFNRIMDRMYGKPTQHNENVNVNLTLQDYLDNLPDPDGQYANAEDIVDDVIEVRSEEETGPTEF